MPYPRAGTIIWGPERPPATRRLDQLDIDDFNAAAIMAARESIELDQPLILLGAVGVGKTTVLAAIHQALRDRETRAKALWSPTRPMRTAWVTAPGWYADVLETITLREQPGFSFRSDYSAEFLAARVPRLFVDDLGAEPATDYARESIVALLTRRHARGLPTWVTSNLAEAELVKRYGERAISRLGEGALIARIAGTSRRPAARRVTA